MGVFIYEIYASRKLGYVKLHLGKNVPIYVIEKKYGLRADNLNIFVRQIATSVQ